MQSVVLTLPETARTWSFAYPRRIRTRSAVRRWTRTADGAGRQSVGAGTSTTLTAAEPPTTRYVLVYLTSLPKEGTDYRGGINEVAISQ